MRTIDPTSIRDDFLAALTDIRDTFAEAENSGMPVKGKKLVAEFSFLSAAILLEGFISDLFVAYINRDNSVFRSHLVGLMKIETADTNAKRALNLASIQIHQHLTAKEIRDVIDSKDWNVSFATIDAMKESAGKWLVNSYKTHFTSLSRAQVACLVATRQMRNFLAHRSKASKAEMQTALAGGDLHTSLRRGQHAIKDVGSFLRSRPTPQQPQRISQYVDALEALAQALCP